MPLYEYHCRTCARPFQLLRPIAEADDPARCPAGHSDIARALSLIARPLRGGAAAPVTPAAGSGGCCGGACGCAH